MKIDPTNGSATPLRLPTRPRAERPPASAAGPVCAPAGTAGNVRPLPDAADGTFDTAKVAAIREEIRSGRYRIDPERIAQGLLASLQDLLPDRKP